MQSGVTLYFDNHATTQPAPEVIDEMNAALRETWGNPHSAHSIGRKAAALVDRARFDVAKLIGAAHPREIIFTSSGTEAINLALHSLTRTVSGSAPPRLVTSTVEHSAVLSPLSELEKSGWEVIRINVNHLGQLELNELEEALSVGATAASFMWANNETGVIFPIERIAELCAQHRVPLHVDAVQAVGKIPVEVKTLPIDFLSLSAHKFHGPKGIGALYSRKGTKVVPLINGGGQENGRRAGTENVPAIVGFGVAAQLALERLPQDAAHMRSIRDCLESALLNLPGVEVNGDPAHRVPSCCNISFAALDAEALLTLLDEQGICASQASACSTGKPEPSHVLRAMRLAPERIGSSIRLSVSRFTTREQVDALVSALKTILGHFS